MKLRLSTRTVFGYSNINWIFLAMHYTADITLAFSSVRHICRDVKYGWLLRKVHAKGASLFFICMYCHIGRGLYYGSYKKIETWKVGVIYFGYHPNRLYGLCSSLRANVLLSCNSNYKFSVCDPLHRNCYSPMVMRRIFRRQATLTRFFAFHFLFPFIIAALAIIHLVFLHNRGAQQSCWA